MNDDNGILSKVPGEFEARASRSLPPAEDAAEEILWAEVDTGTLWQGRVRIRFRRRRFKHGRHSHWGWVGEFAERCAERAE